MAVGEHREETMAESEETTAAQQAQSEEPQKLIEDVEDTVQAAVQVCVERENGQPISVVARLSSVVRRHKLPSKSKRFTVSDALDGMRQGGLWRGFLVAAVGIATLAAITGVVAVALLFISSSLNAAFASFLVAVSTIGFIMAFFFSSITVVYVGALGFGGLTIGSIAFFSVWAVIILSGWAAIAWVIWQGLSKAFQFGGHLVFLAGAYLSSSPAAQKLSAKFKGYIGQVQVYKKSIGMHFETKFRKCISLKCKKAVD